MGFGQGCYRYYWLGCLCALSCFGGATRSGAASLERVAASTLHYPQEAVFEGYGLPPLFPNLTFDNPVAVVTPPGEQNRLFVVERKGRIIAVTNLAAPNKTLFLDLTVSLYSRYLEAGLLGLAFHPGYATNRTFFVFRTRVTSSDGITNALHDELSRFETSPDNPNRALSSSERRVWAQFDESEEHNAGDLQFGPDGYLYISLGNGPSPVQWAAERQPIDQGFFGGILRIDVDRREHNLAPNPHPGITTEYSIPLDNPFVGITVHGDASVDPSRVRTEYYAIGFRNPWRMSFDPLTGALYCGDVGEGQMEEVNIVGRGGNYGWPYWEGTNQTVWNPQAPRSAAISPPFYAYLHGRETNQGSAVVGGLVYRGESIPELYGAYVFGDYVSGHIWALPTVEATGRDVKRLASEPGVSAFGRDPRNGDVLVVNHSSGVIKRLTYVKPGDAPEFPQTLADSGVFANLETLAPAPGIEPYSINVPFWSDNAIKSRWFSLPDPKQTIQFAPDTAWTFPTGSVWIKHFELALTNNAPASRRRVETRVLVRNAAGVYGVTYRWGDSRTNAFLVPELGLRETFLVSEDAGTIRTQVWNYPGRHECLMCHTPSAGYVLGFNTAQLNRRCEGEDKGEGEDEGEDEERNQIQALSDAGYFQTPVSGIDTLRALAPASNTSYPIEYRVRSYWAANCSQCHNPKGVDTTMWDARITTPLNDAGIVGVPPNFNIGNVGVLENGVVVVDHGSPENRIIHPNSLSNSVMLTRISTPIGVRMPPVGSTVLDSVAIDLLTEWIQTLPPSPWAHQDIGPLETEGSAAVTGDRFRVAASGLDSSSSGGRDAGHYLYLPLSANGQIIARLSSIQISSTQAVARGAVMVREDLAEDAAAAGLWLDAQGQATFNRGLAAGPFHSTRLDSSADRLSWMRLSREGDNVRGFASSDGTNWLALDVETMPMAERIYAGLFTSVDAHSGFGEAAFEQVRVLQVALTNPVPERIYLQPAIIALAAEVQSVGTVVDRVEFYSGTNRIGGVTHPPYAMTWTNAIVGRHMLTAKAVDAMGATVTSRTVAVDVLGPAPMSSFLYSNGIAGGDWKGVFGQEGSIVVGDSTNLPPYATVEVAGAGTIIWASKTNDSRALQRKATSARIAAAWEAGREFSIQLGLLDGRLGRVGLYLLDWNSNNARGEMVEIIDPASGNVLDRRIVSAFSNGVYLAWQVRGRVQLRVTALGEGTAVVSGFFLDSDDNQPPVVRLTSPRSESTFRLPTTVTLDAEALDPDGQIAGVEFLVDGSSIGQVLQAPYQMIWKNMLTGRHTLQVQAIDDLAESGWSEPVEVVTQPAATTVGFVGVDLITQGKWKYRYGKDGFLLVSHATNAPSYAAVNAINANEFIFIDWSVREMALEHLLDNFGIEAGWYPSTAYNPQFSVDLQLRDGENHLVSFYLLDFDFPSRLQRIDLITPAGEILDSQEASQFSGGKYYTWTLRGPVTARFTGLRGLPVLSGIFFDSETNEPPTIEVLSPTNGTRLLAPSPLVLRARVVDAEENIRQVEYFADGRRIAAMTQPPYEFLWNEVLSGEHALSAKATDAGGRTSESTNVQLDVGWLTGRARSFTSDGETGGRWKSRYGRDGYLVVNHATNLPVFAQLTAAGVKGVTRVDPSTNSPALEHVSDWFGVEAAWLPEATGTNSFSFDLRLADGRSHRVALYVLKPDSWAGSQRIEIFDAATGTLLDQQVISEFSSGRYLSWIMRGRLTIRITGLDGIPALSALFFDPETTPYEKWTATYFTDLERTMPAMSEPDADPDRDGLDNRMEYALGLNPRQPDVTGRPSVGLVAGYFLVQYTRPKTATDVSLILEWSADLVQWSGAEDALAPFSVSDDGNVQRITLRSIVAVSDQPVGFLRFSARVSDTE